VGGGEEGAQWAQMERDERRQIVSGQIVSGQIVSLSGAGFWPSGAAHRATEMVCFDLIAPAFKAALLDGPHLATFSYFCPPLDAF